MPITRVENVTASYEENRYNITEVFGKELYTYLRYINSQELDRLARDPLAYDFIAISCDMDDINCRSSID